MNYRSLKECVLDLEKHGMLVRIKDEVDPDLEMAEIQRRVSRAKGPAIFYEKVKGSSFPAVSNLYGTLERAHFIFRKTLPALKKLFQLKGDPGSALKNPFTLFGIPGVLMHALPLRAIGGPVFAKKTTVSKLPQIKSWPDDGGPFILLPQVYTEDIEKRGVLHSNLGMYRIQLAGNQYAADKEIGLHYQLRRDIGIHHTKAKLAKKPLRVSIFVGGPPAHAFAAVMYLPEGMPEVAFAGALAGRNFRYDKRRGFTVSTEADFCITGWVDPELTKPEGPFGDHLGYYSLKHSYPFMKIETVYHRKDAIWPFTVVGRPPQEDSVLGKLVQEIAGPVIPSEIPGVKEVHAVDEAGVHPLLLAVASERYAPYLEKKPREILTLANALLGYGPCSLAKYLIIASGEDNPHLSAHHVEEFFSFVLERVDWTRDLHFQTRTTMDSLDYSGPAVHEGSKVVIAAAGAKKRALEARLPSGFKIPDIFTHPQFFRAGMLLLEGPKFKTYEAAAQEFKMLTAYLEKSGSMEGIPLIIICDDEHFTRSSLENFLWVVFTRSDPARDIYGAGSFTDFKHWGCTGPLIIDARLKPHHAPPLVEDPKITAAVDRFALPGKPLHNII